MMAGKPLGHDQDWSSAKVGISLYVDYTLWIYNLIVIDVTSKFELPGPGVRCMTLVSLQITMRHEHSMRQKIPQGLLYLCRQLCTNLEMSRPHAGNAAIKVSVHRG